MYIRILYGKNLYRLLTAEFIQLSSKFTHIFSMECNLNLSSFSQHLDERADMITVSSTQIHIIVQTFSPSELDQQIKSEPSKQKAESRYTVRATASSRSFLNFHFRFSPLLLLLAHLLMILFHSIPSHLSHHHLRFLRVFDCPTFLLPQYLRWCSVLSDLSISISSAIPCTFYLFHFLDFQPSNRHILPLPIPHTYTSMYVCVCVCICLWPSVPASRPKNKIKKSITISIQPRFHASLIPLLVY